MLELYFAQNRFYDPADRRFTQEDIVKDSHNWYAYCGNNPTLHVDPLGLDSYIFYDPYSYKSDDFISMWALSNYISQLKYSTFAFFGTDVHTIAMTTEDELIKQWNEMGNNGSEKIDAVIFSNHGSKDTWRISTVIEDGKEASYEKQNRIDLDFFIKNEDLLVSQEIDYFAILSCSLGSSEKEASGNGSSAAMYTINSNQKIGALLASDAVTVTTPFNSGIMSKSSRSNGEKGDGFKLYMKSEDGNVTVEKMGYKFASLYNLFNAMQDKKSEVETVQAIGQIVLDGLSHVLKDH